MISADNSRMIHDRSNVVDVNANKSIAKSNIAVNKSVNASKPVDYDKLRQTMAKKHAQCRAAVVKDRAARKVSKNAKIVIMKHLK